MLLLAGTSFYFSVSIFRAVVIRNSGESKLGSLVRCPVSANNSTIRTIDGPHVILRPVEELGTLVSRPSLQPMQKMTAWKPEYCSVYPATDDREISVGTLPHHTGHVGTRASHPMTASTAVCSRRLCLEKVKAYIRGIRL